LVRKKTEGLRQSALTGGGAAATPAGGAVVELLQMQIQRLETELRRKTEESEAERKRLQEEVQKKPKEAASTVNLLEKVESEKLKAELKTVKDNDERQKARIEALTKQVAEETKAREESDRQMALKVKALAFAEKKLERVDQILAESKTTSGRKEAALQQEIASKAAQIEQLNTLGAQQKERIDLLVKEMEGRGQDLSAKVQEAQARHAEANDMTSKLKAEVKELTRAVEVARANDLQARQDHDNALKQRDAELEEAKKKFTHDLAKMEQSVAAIQSGRGRLEQLKELQDEHARKEAESEAKIAELTEQVESLSAENEALAESNAAMVSAMENAGAEVSDALASKLDTKGWEGRVQTLEAQLSGQQDTIAKLEATREKLKERIDTLTLEVTKKGDAIADLEARLKSALSDAQFKSEALDTTQKTLATVSAESKAKDAAQTQHIAAVEAALQEAHGVQENMKKIIDELEARHTALDSEFKSAKAKFEADLKEATEERSSIKERMNEAIQERWLAEEQLKKIQDDREKELRNPSGANMAAGATAELEAKVKDLTRKIQDAEGEVKRAKLDAQEQRKKQTEAALLIKEREAENSKLNEVLKTLTHQLLDLEGMNDDLAHAEALVEKLETENKALHEQLAALKQ
jgi:chromosome segregation ATPase